MKKLVYTKMNKAIFIGILVLLLTGCASNTMIIDNQIKESISPIGLFVCASTQILDDKNTAHRDFVIQNSFDTFESLLGEKYKIVNLNNLVQYKKAFKKPFGGFYINDKMIGECAKENNCKTYLIVYYAETETNFSFILPAPGLNKSFLITAIGSPQKNSRGFVMHSNCSLYGWLVNTEKNKIIKRSHSALEPYKNYIKNNSGGSDATNYALFLSQITKNMFSGLN